MKYNIIATGSKGNAVILEDYLMIDCGVSFKSLAPYYQDLKLVLLTHIHGDHFKKSTIKKLALERPTLRWMCGKWLVKELVDLGVMKQNIDIVDYNAGMYYGNPKIFIEAFELFHNVENLGYKLYFNNTKVLYATDTNKIDHITAKDFDYYFLEANHTMEEIERRIEEKVDAGKYCYELEAKNNHLCKEKTDAFIIDNAGENSQFIYLHGHEE